MIICHIIIGLNVGGAELMLKRLIGSFKALETAPRQVVISITTMGAIGHTLQASGIEVHELGVKSFKNAAFCLLKLFKIIRLIKPDIIQTWMYHADLCGGLVGRLAGCKNIVWGIRTTDISSFASKKTMLIRWFCAKLSRIIPRSIVCVADKSCEEHVKLGYVLEKMVVIPNGFDFGSFHATSADVNALRMALGLQQDELVVGTVARFNPAKDPHNFVQAACLVAAQIPHARFLMVGKNCDKKNSELMEWIEATGFSDRFILLGERNDVNVCLAVIDVFCLASVNEGFPNALGEAMAMHKPCVATNVGGAGFLLGDCGIIVPKKNPKELAVGIMTCLSLSAEDRKALGLRAHQRVTTEFTMIKVRERFGMVYSSLLEKNVDELKRYKGETKAC